MHLLEEILSEDKFRPYDKIKDYQISLYTEDDYESLMDLFDHTFPGYMSDELWIWKNNKNPFGKLITVLLKDNDNVIASYSVSPKEFLIHGDPISCVQSLDTMTLSAYRGKGISTYLGNLNYEYARRSKYAYVYGFPNNVSQYLFEVKLEWNIVIKSEPLLKPISNKTLKTQKKDYNIKKIENFSNDYNEFWAKIQKKYHLIINKTKKYLNWRFSEHPEINYEKYLIIDPETDEIKAYFVLKKYADQEGNQLGHIVDFLIGTDVFERKVDIFKFIEAESTEILGKTCDSLSFWMPDTQLKRFCLENLDYKIKPALPYFGYKILRKDIQLEILKSLKNWYITMSNNDIF